MHVSRPVGLAFLPLVLAIGSFCPSLGCGSGSDATMVQVDPELKKDTNKMLEQMSKDQIAKYKKQGGRKR